MVHFIHHSHARDSQSMEKKDTVSPERFLKFYLPWICLYLLQTVVTSVLKEQGLNAVCYYPLVLISWHHIVECMKTSSLFFFSAQRLFFITGTDPRIFLEVSNKKNSGPRWKCSDERNHWFTSVVAITLSPGLDCLRAKKHTILCRKCLSSCRTLQTEPDFVLGLYDSDLCSHLKPVCNVLGFKSRFFSPFLFLFIYLVI